MQYWRGKEQHCTASRPSRPPGARGPAPAPHRVKRDQPGPGALWEVEFTWEPRETGRPEEGEGGGGGGGGEGEGRRDAAVPRKAAF